MNSPTHSSDSSEPSKNPFAASVETVQPLPGRTAAAPTAGWLGWVGLVIGIAFWALRLGLGAALEMGPVLINTMIFGPFIALLLLTIWWLVYKRKEQELGHAFAVLAALIGGAVVMGFGSHPSMSLALFFSAPSLVVIAWPVLERLTRPLAADMRFAVLPVAILACWSMGLGLRSHGVDGKFGADYSFRWEPSPEEKFMTKAGEARPEQAGKDGLREVKSDANDWPGFRGPARDGHVTGVKLNPDLAANPPKQLWKTAVGPGWGSMAIIGQHLFTQEQRGPNECVVAYSTTTGKQIWVHTDVNSRFEEPVAGAGPRATPQFADGKLFTLGANGKLNCLNATSGEVVWAQDISQDAAAKPPMWGFSSSPLISQGVVIVVAGGKQNKGVLGYRQSDGKLLWSQGLEETVETGEHTYASAHPAVIDGVAQAVIISNAGMYSVAVEDGKLLWKYLWIVKDMNRVVQPHEIDPHHWIIGTSFGEGSRLIEVSSDAGKFATKEIWQSKGLKPYFNDFVSYQGFLYGFDNDIFVCVDAETGKRSWKGGRYGAGQVILLSDQGLLLVLGEYGEVILLEANSKKHVELGKFEGIEGKTWNHPVLIGDRLYLRNAEEMACFQLKTL